MSTIALLNSAPASGKTTTALSVADQLGKFGARVLLVDLTPDADLTAAVSRVRTVSLDHALRNQLPLATCIAPTILRGVDLMSIPTATAELPIARQRGVNGLGGLLDKVSADYAYVIIDVPPSNVTATSEALSAAHVALVPVPAEEDSLHDLSAAMSTIDRARAESNPSLRALLLLTMVQGAPDSRKVVSEILTSFPGLVLRTRIPLDESMNRLLDRKSETEHPSAGAVAYQRLAVELASRVPLATR